MNRSEKFYSLVLRHLNLSKLPYMVGGSYALMYYLGTHKVVKDLDIVCTPTDAKRILTHAQKVGLKTELTYKHWLGKIFNEKDYIDIIFRTSNKRVEVKKNWFKYGRVNVLFGEKVLMLPPEEVMINKMYVFGRDCYHGHDIYKLIHKLGKNLDWKRIWLAIKKDWQVLDAHIVLFDFVFPNDEYKIPDWLRSQISKKKKKKIKTQRKFQGRLLSLVDYPSKKSNKLHNHPLEVRNSL